MLKKKDTVLFYTKTDDFTFNYDDIRIPYTEEQLKGYKQDEKGYYTPDSYDKQKKWYAHPKGQIADDTFFISIISRKAKERTGYPTQKPLALLERIIKASSNDSDMVLDPFCGCATTCVAAEKLGRQWIGIDKEKETINLINKRLKREIPPHLFRGDANYITKPPKRTDYPHRIPKGTKEKLYGEQQGYCNGCKRHFEIRNLNIDHIIPKSSGGTNEYYNLQLLCGSCNSLKSNRTMTHLKKRLWEEGIIKHYEN